MEYVAQDELSEGRIVRFDKLGSLYPSVSSSPSEKEKDVTAANITKVKVNYRPGKRILNAMQAAEKKKVKSSDSSSSDETQAGE